MYFPHIICRYGRRTAWSILILADRNATKEKNKSKWSGVYIGRMLPQQVQDDDHILSLIPINYLDALSGATAYQRHASFGWRPGDHLAREHAGCTGSRFWSSFNQWNLSNFLRSGPRPSRDKQLSHCLKSAASLQWHNFLSPGIQENPQGQWHSSSMTKNTIVGVRIIALPANSSVLATLLLSSTGSIKDRPIGPNTPWPSRRSGRTRPPRSLILSGHNKTGKGPLGACRNINRDRPCLETS